MNKRAFTFKSTTSGGKFFFSSRRRHTRYWRDWSSDVCSSDLLLLADPFSFPVDAFLRRLDEDRPGLAVIGGLASAAARPGGNRLALDGEVSSEGAVGVLLDGADVRTIRSEERRGGKEGRARWE